MEHDQIKSLGVFACTVAIAPTEVDLNNATSEEEMISWEVDRINKIAKLLQELLDVAKAKKWF